MSNEEDRKSMDDVLASIRRIVRSEKDPEQPMEPPADSAATPMAEPASAPDLPPQGMAPGKFAPQDTAIQDSVPSPKAEMPPSDVAPAPTPVDAGREPTLVPSAGLGPTPTSEAPAPAAPDDPGEVPLALTSDMRLDESDAKGGSDLAQAMDAASTEDPMPESAEETVSDPVAPAAPSIDPETLKGLMRTVILEELTSSDAAGEAIRAVIRDELMTGEIGQNISQNVLALIQAEVAKATGS
jgi:cell pole-organizing protein PopZ